MVGSMLLYLKSQREKENCTLKRIEKSIERSIEKSIKVFRKEHNALEKSIENIIEKNIGQSIEKNAVLHRITEQTRPRHFIGAICSDTTLIEGASESASRDLQKSE